MAMTEETGLYALGLEEFTAARNALAARLKKAGKTDDASRVRSLAKPSVSAWAVNQVYWRHRKEFARLIAVGDRFRQAQAAHLAGRGGDLRGALDARRDVVTQLTALAAAALEQSGHSPSADIMRRVTTTLDALASYGSDSEGAPAGRLTEDLDPPGFDAFAALVPRGTRDSRPGEASRIIPFQQKPSPTAKPPRRRETDAERRAVERKTATTAIRQAERTLFGARRDAAKAEAALKRAARVAKETERAKAQLETQFEKAAAKADAARTAARRIASEAEAAAQAVDDAERALDKARRALAALD